MEGARGSDSDSGSGSAGQRQRQQQRQRQRQRQKRHSNAPQRPGNYCAGSRARSVRHSARCAPLTEATKGKQPDSLSGHSPATPRTAS